MIPDPNHALAKNPTSGRRLRVLISAYACEPGKGSEPGVGWNFAKEMAQHHTVWVLTRSNNREVIEQELGVCPEPDLHFFYHDLPRWARWWKKRGRGAQFYYYLWQLTAVSTARAKHAEVGFDLSQHITFVRYWAPSCLAWLNIPFVWGPVGGGESLPDGFLKQFSVKGRIYEWIRSSARFLGEHDPFVRWTAKHAVKCYVTTEQSAERVVSIGGKCPEQLFESGFSTDELDALGNVGPAPRSPIRFMSVGRLLEWKGFQLGLRAFAKADIADSEYWIVGDGPARAKLERDAKRLRVEDRVTFWGSVERAHVLNLLSQCHALVHPSLHDSGGWVCLEAMAAGRPVICLDWGGPGFQVTGETGFMIRPRSPDQTVDELSSAMRACYDDAKAMASMSRNARKRVREKFTWAVKADMLSGVYRHLAAGQSKTCSGGHPT